MSTEPCTQNYIPGLKEALDAVGSEGVENGGEGKGQSRQGVALGMGGLTLRSRLMGFPTRGRVMSFLVPWLQAPEKNSASTPCLLDLSGPDRYRTWITLDSCLWGKGTG